MARPDHAAEMRGLAAVVRHACDACIADQVPVHDDVVASLVVVESWLSGAAVDARAFGDARDRAWAAGESASKAGAAIGGSPQWRERDGERVLLRRAQWLGGAVGNLCQVALKEPGWNKGTSVMDAATYALKDGAAAVLEDVRVRARAAPSSLKPRAPPKPASLPLDDVVARVGPARAKRLKKRHARIDPAVRADEKTTRALLRGESYRATAAVMAFDAVYGGLTFVDNDGEPTLCGAYACLVSGAHDAPHGGRKDLVPVAYAPSDLVYYLDGEGAAWVEDTVGDDEPARCANDGDALVALLLDDA